MNNNMNCNINIIIYGGIIMYSIVIITTVLVFICNSMNTCSSFSNYLQIEINKSIKNSNNIMLFWMLFNCGIILLITTLYHIVIKIGIFNSISYNISYWLLGTGLGLYLIPFVVYSYRLIIYLNNYNIYFLSVLSPYKYNNIVSNCYYYMKEISTGTNYNNSYMFNIVDISIIMNIYRGLNNIMNWLYQMIYYGVRLWLVFVLHSFSLGCFSSLLTVITDNNMILNMFYFGLLGISIMLFLLVVFYLSIQIYVYISFSLSFLYSTILLLFVHPIYPISLHNISNNVVSKISINNTYLLIPVSLVDILGLNMIMYIIILYLSLLIIIPIILTNVLPYNTYYYIYNCYSGSNSHYY